MPKNLPENVLESAKCTIKEQYTTFNGIGVVISKLSQTQMSYVLLNNLFTHFDLRPYDEVCIYNLQPGLPMMTPHCAVFTGNDIASHIGPLVCTDVMSWQACRLANDADVYYYVYDPMLLKGLQPKDLQTIRKSNTTFIARTKEHKEMLKKDLNIITHNTLVYNFDLHLMTDMMKGNK